MTETTMNTVIEALEFHAAHWRAWLAMSHIEDAERQLAGAKLSLAKHALDVVRAGQPLIPLGPGRAVAIRQGRLAGLPAGTRFRVMGQPAAEYMVLSHLRMPPAGTGMIWAAVVAGKGPRGEQAGATIDVFESTPVEVLS